MTTGDEPRLSGQPTSGDDPRLGGEAALVHAIEALNDPDPKVQERAAFSLADAGNQSAGAVLIGLLRSKRDKSTRARSAKALGRLKVTDAFEPLLECARDGSEKIEVRVTAVRALRDLGNQDAVGPLQAMLDSLVVPLDWGHRSALLQQAIIDTLAVLGGMEWLLASLLEEAQHRQIKAVINLSYLDDPCIVPALLTLLNEADPADGYFIYFVAQSLGELGNPSAVEPLINKYYSLPLKYGHARTGLISALGKIGDPAALDTLISVALDPASGRDITAIIALGRLGDIRAVPVLVQKLHHPYAQIRFRAVQALGRLYAKHPDIASHVIAVLADTDNRVQCEAISILAQQREQRAVDALIAALDFSGAHGSARKALRRIGTPEALAALESRS
jgi:HEAT repeat protein